MDLGLNGKRAVVTGAASGLGAACCKSLADEGVEIVMVDIRQPDYSVPTKHAFVQVDLSDLENVEKTIKNAVDHLGQIDILVNCAGLWPTRFVCDMPTSEWVKTMDVNMTSVFILCRDFVNHCVEDDRQGVIMNVTSQAGFGGATSGHAHYAAAKAAMINFTRSLARETGKKKIRVNAIAPGMMKTAMAKDALEDRLETYLKRIPVGRISEPSEVADVITFLVSEKNTYMTGAAIDVSGGMLMH